jgi:hypothetical protein
MRSLLRGEQKTGRATRELASKQYGETELKERPQAISAPG